CASALMFWISLPSRGASPDGAAAPVWPPVGAGMWEVDSKRTPPNGKVQAWKEIISECTDPAEMVRGYWGLGILGRAGCQYHATETAPGEFKVTGECMVRHAGVATSEATVKMKGTDEFEMTVAVVE